MDNTISPTVSRVILHQQEVSQLERKRHFALTVSWVSLTICAVSLISNVTGHSTDKLMAAGLITCSIVSLAFSQRVWAKQKKIIDAGPGRARFPVKP